MPATLDDIRDQVSTALDADETLAVRSALRFESTVTVPADADVTAALAALDEAGRKKVRAELALYPSGKSTLSGGSDGLEYDPAWERWSVRNELRLLFGFPAEPEPIAGTDGMYLVRLTLGSYASGDEFGG